MDSNSVSDESSLKKLNTTVSNLSSTATVTKNSLLELTHTTQDLINKVKASEEEYDKLSKEYTKIQSESKSLRDNLKQLYLVKKDIEAKVEVLSEENKKSRQLLEELEEFSSQTAAQTTTGTK